MNTKNTKRIINIKTDFLIFEFESFKEKEMSMGNGKRKELSETIHDNLRRLKLVDINLQVEAARIHEANGVRVIAEEIKKIIDELAEELEEFDREVEA